MESKQFSCGNLSSAFGIQTPRKKEQQIYFCVFLEHAFYLTMSPSVAVHARSCNCLVIFALATEQSLAMKSETKYLHICQSLVLLASPWTQRGASSKISTTCVKLGRKGEISQNQLRTPFISCNPSHAPILRAILDREMERS